MRKERAPKPTETLRLVKTWLPTSLVREMDHTILSTGGAYNGRDDFIREAITDRLAEERSRPVKASTPAVLLLSPKSKAKPKKEALRGASLVRDAEAEGGWASAPTLPAHAVGGILYGLHNRDYPTLWAARSLLLMSAARGGPLAWTDYVSAVLEAAWNIGAQLARMDLERGSDEQKASVGFPTNAEKRQSAEARFLEHMVGVPDRESGPAGPLLAMKLAGTKQEGQLLTVAPTREAIALWDQLTAAGFAGNARPPHPPAAWRVFSKHLRTHLQQDHTAWVRVLRAVGDGRTRDELITHFAPDWAGAAAATNVAGYVSRGREWGLIEAKLKEGRYVATDLGREAVEANT